MLFGISNGRRKRLFDRAFGADTRAGAAVDAIHRDYGPSIDHLYRLGGTDIQTGPASRALIFSNAKLHITIVQKL
jgi:hypothetical protein